MYLSPVNPMVVWLIQPQTHVQFVGSLWQVHNHVVSLNYGSKGRLDQSILDHVPKWLFYCF